jgi:hypothetical protein
MFGGTQPTARPARPALRRRAALGAPGPSRVKPGRAGSSRAGRCRSARCPKRPAALSSRRIAALPPAGGAHLAGRLLRRLGARRLRAHAAAVHAVPRCEPAPHRTAPHRTAAADNNTAVCRAADNRHHANVQRTTRSGQSMRQAPPRATGTEGGCTFHFDGVSFFGVVQYSLASSEPAPSAKYLKGEP